MISQVSSILFASFLIGFIALFLRLPASAQMPGTKWKYVDSEMYQGSIGLVVTRAANPGSLEIGYVVNGSPAAKAGMQVGDIITAIHNPYFDSSPLSYSEKLDNLEKLSAPSGTKLRISAIRKDRAVEFDVETKSLSNEELIARTKEQFETSASLGVKKDLLFLLSTIAISVRKSGKSLELLDYCARQAEASAGRQSFLAVQYLLLLLLFEELNYATPSSEGFDFERHSDRIDRVISAALLKKYLEQRSVTFQRLRVGLADVNGSPDEIRWLLGPIRTLKELYKQQRQQKNCELLMKATRQMLQNNSISTTEESLRWLSQ